MPRKIAIVAVVLALALIALTGCETKVVTTDGAVPLNTVTAQGLGEAPASPDEAQMYFGVTLNDADAKKALEGASVIAEKITAAVKGSGVDAKDIQTANVSVQPEYDYSENKAPRVTGYRASLQVRVKIRDIGMVGEVIQAANGAGANEIGGPAFTLSDDSDARDIAIADAIDDARRRAEAMAKAAGKSVGDVISVSEAGITMPPVYYGAERAYSDAGATAVPIEPGQLDITANVTVVFELK
jgi:hypothetical protein